MAEFQVELVGGPHAGRRALRSPRQYPPEEIPVVLRRSPRTGTEEDERSAGARSYAIYRYSHRDDADDTYVYRYSNERVVQPRP